jgi:hypothetical protein
MSAVDEVVDRGDAPAIDACCRIIRPTHEATLA